MKVDVITVADATFKSRWRWWSNWIDVALFNHESLPWLVQMRVSRTNCKEFRSVCITGHCFSFRYATVNEIGDLTQMNGTAK